MDAYLHILLVLSCVGNGLPTGSSPVQGVNKIYNFRLICPRGPRVKTEEHERKGERRLTLRALSVKEWLKAKQAIIFREKNKKSQSLYDYSLVVSQCVLKSKQHSHNRHESPSSQNMVPISDNASVKNKDTSLCFLLPATEWTGKPTLSCNLIIQPSRLYNEKRRPPNCCGSSWIRLETILSPDHF
jgi:hypothetical protein